jgi:hypothetical protein
VRIGHRVLPDFKIHPPIGYEIDTLPDESREIVIPQLVPGEQITVSYLYFPPTIYADVNLYLKSDEGFAKQIAVLPVQQYPKWLRAVAGVLILAGAADILYLLIILGMASLRP